MDEMELINCAVRVMEKAYAPYSEFFVGAAVVAASGKIYTGCNIENAAYPAGLCAERAAFASAISAGEREFSAIAVVGGRNGEITENCPPCGVCRQFMSEFCNENFQIILYDGLQESSFTLGELLPSAFGGEIL